MQDLSELLGKGLFALQVLCGVTIRLVGQGS